MKPNAILTLASVAAATLSLTSHAADADTCTYDFAEISKAKYEVEDPNAPNAIPDPLGFVRIKPYIWRPEKKADLPFDDAKAEAVLVAEVVREEGLISLFSPQKVVDMIGEKSASCLHNFAMMTMKAPKPGKYRFSCNYRGNHTLGSATWSAYFRLLGERDRDVVTVNFPDTGDDSDYWNSRNREFTVPEGVTNLTAYLRLDGVGYLKVSKLKITPVVEVKEPEVLFRVHGSYDGTFGVRAGEVESVPIQWRTGKGFTLHERKSGIEFTVPKGFSFVGFNGKVEKVEREPDGTTRVACRCADYGDWLRVYPLGAFYSGYEATILVRADGAAGTKGELVFQAKTMRKVERVGGESGGGSREKMVKVGEVGKLELVTVPAIPVTLPKRYRAGMMFTGLMEFFMNQPEANRAYAEHLRKCGVDWIMPDLRWMKRDASLVPMWREVGFRYITPTANDYFSNGYAVPRSTTRPEADRFVKKPGRADNRDFRLSSCPAAIYEERPFFLTNFVASIAKWTKGCDGMWSNWEPFYFGGCYCKGCQARLADWKAETGDSEAHFHSMQHGRICKTIQKHFKRIFGAESPAFMPAICVAEGSSYALLNDYAPDKLAKDYAGDMNWLPLWGPYVAWEPHQTGAWSPIRGKTVAAFIAAADARAETDRLYPHHPPKLMYQPSGGNWIIQPEWLEIMMDAALFNRIEACVPWVLPGGGDARLWNGFARHVNRAAKYEDAIWDGKPADAATTVTPKSGFAQTCPKPIGAYMPKAAQYFNYPTLRQKTFDWKGVRHVAVLNFNEGSHAEFTLRTTGLSAGNYAIVREDGLKPLGDRTVTAAELAKTGVDLSVPVSATRVFEIRRMK